MKVSVSMYRRNRGLIKHRARDERRGNNVKIVGGRKYEHANEVGEGPCIYSTTMHDA
jgi:hypothetical protein